MIPSIYYKVTVVVHVLNSYLNIVLGQPKYDVKIGAFRLRRVPPVLGGARGVARLDARLDTARQTSEKREASRKYLANLAARELVRIAAAEKRE